MKLVIFAATDRSLLSLGLILMSLRRGYSIAGVVIRSTFSADRISEELSIGGIRSAAKLLRYLRERISFGKRSASGLEAFFNDNNIQKRSISSFCTAHGIPLLESSNLNNQEVLIFLDALTPNLVLFGGGGIIRNEVLKRVPVLNCHMGLLPKYRGNHPWIWALANKEYNQIGVSVHLMEARLDQGPIVENTPLDIKDCKSLNDIVSALEYRMIPAILNGLAVIEKNYQDIDLYTISQKETDGHQYFIPHNKITKLAENNLQKYQRNLL